MGGFRGHYSIIHEYSLNSEVFLRIKKSMKLQKNVKKTDLLPAPLNE